MNIITKTLLLAAIRKTYPLAVGIYIHIADKVMIVKNKDGTVINKKFESTSEYLPLLADSHELKTVETIYFNVEKSTLLIRGDIDKIKIIDL